MSGGNNKNQASSSKKTKTQATSGENNNSDPFKQYRMLLNTIEQRGDATFEFKLEETGPSNEPTWAAIVTVTEVAPSLSNSIYIGTFRRGTASTKSEAKDNACKEMLDMFAGYGILPKIKLQAPKSG